MQGFDILRESTLRAPQNAEKVDATSQAILQELTSLTLDFVAPTQSIAPLSTASAQGSAAGPFPPLAPRLSPRGRNLIVCIDGTANQFSHKNTNVVELYHRLMKDDDQLTYYSSGIGTYAIPSSKSWKYYKQVILNKIDLAIAWNLDKILLSAYRWLCENYREGDKIYLFGFSRGAYQVRVLSAMIKCVGLLYNGNLGQIPFAFQLYKETENITSTDVRRKTFVETFSRHINVELVGVWDTVSSIGLFREKTLPGTTDGMKHVKCFRHALALHERRVKFLPENAREGSGPLLEDVTSQPGHPPHTKEVWFSGSHSNIGRGAKLNEYTTTFGPSLRWMTYEATLAGVRFRDIPNRWRDVSISNSLTAKWKVFEPFVRLTYRSERGLTCRPHLGRPRKIQRNQLIHETAFNSDPTPASARWRARLPGSLEWDRNSFMAHNMIELDCWPYYQDAAKSHVLELLKR